MAERGGEAVARSRSLFLWDDGSPMRFYVRPGLAKLRLAPLVLAGGGRLCRVQEPGAVLLAQPGEAAPGGAVSTEYVTECVERNQRLPLEAFRLPAAPPAPPAASPRGRLPFTEAEDAALLRAVRGRGEAPVSGRALWKELERAGLTRHSWQAMRDRYLRHLRPLLAGELGAAVGAWRRGAERLGGGGRGERRLMVAGGRGRPRTWTPLRPGRRRPRVSAEPRETEEAGQGTSLFEAANREFESTESGSDTSDISEELSMQDGEGKSPGKTASGLKTGPEDCVLPDTQLQREERPKSTCSSSVVGEVVKTMQRFMEKFDMDLFTVTQAFLKNTGEVETTFYFLQTGQRLDGYPVWSREDDLELQKDDEHVRNKLIAKFGAENVAKRVAFRKS
ncbi:telomeric repeat-binding factor 2-interacting protein 1 isoform X1 [Phalacrocorax aristotelis]|uniref:telomeric repeat-binding factor 2-interacting protein 1 isoform X1 n=1 Tax=Phalacrocorax aristotelis TaxID=126867 RepID=UPI003F4B211C